MLACDLLMIMLACDLLMIMLACDLLMIMLACDLLMIMLDLVIRYSWLMSALSLGPSEHYS